MTKRAKKIDYKTVAQHFYVDETSPSGLRWTHDVRAGRGIGRLILSKGDVAGCLYKGRYRVRADGVIYLVHRVVYCLVHGKVDPRLEVDHKNGNSAHNWHSNLRQVTGKVNSHNGKMRRNNTSGVKGVFRQESRGHAYWVAACMADGENVKVCFSVRRLGESGAKVAAQCCRRDMIFLLNQLGEDYTSRHNQDKGAT